MRKTIYSFIVLFLLGIALLTFWARSAKPPATLGATQGKLAACPDSPNCVSSQAVDDGHKAEPLTYSEDAGLAIKRLRSVIESMPRSQVITESEDYLHAEFHSAWLGFIDDVECLNDPSEKVIHIRSASRLGHSDLGVNRERVEEIRSAFSDR